MKMGKKMGKWSIALVVCMAFFAGLSPQKAGAEDEYARAMREVFEEAARVQRQFRMEAERERRRIWAESMREYQEGYHAADDEYRAAVEEYLGPVPRSLTPLPMEDEMRRQLEAVQRRMMESWARPR